MTVPDPFKLATSKRLGTKVTHETPLSSAEIQSKFMTNTRSNHVPENTNKKLTVPFSPGIRKSVMYKKPKALSYEEKEKVEMEEAAKHAFKAQPFNKKIFESGGVMGVPKVAAKQSTETVEFNFKSASRALSRPSTAPALTASKSDSTPFKARPMPTFNKPDTRSPRPTKKTLTIPMSPKFNGVVKQKMQSMTNTEKKRKAKAKAASTFTQPKKLTLTEPKEFNLQTEMRSSMYKSQFEAQIERERKMEKEMRDVKATPIYHPPAPKYSKVETKKELTEPIPFHLQSEARHEFAQASMAQQLSREESIAKSDSQFRAKPLPKSTHKPQKVINSDEKKKIPITKAMNISLQSEKRSIDRKKFDEQISLKMDELEKLKLLCEKENMEKEFNEIKQLRNNSIENGGMLFKAKPIQQKDLYKVKTIREPMMLTEPKSPMLRTRERSFLKRQNAVV